MPASISDTRIDGLSPPTRGIPLRSGGMSTRWWSIPAYAGDPLLCSHHNAAARVYPRLRGGSPLFVLRRQRVLGLSPPTRGIPYLATRVSSSAGSIPAYAGDPCRVGGSLLIRTVYPRLRGGSSSWLACAMPASGLSPPTRGILLCETSRHARRGSIPAYAGDPLYRSAPRLP